MRFMARGLFGLCLLTLTLGLLALAGQMLVQAVQERRAGDHGPRIAKERVFAVEVAPIVLVDHAPVISTFGEIVSGQTLELRAAAGGALVQMSPNFREGGEVFKGEMLFQTDPSNAKSKLLLAEAELAEARSDLIDATSDFALAGEEVEAAETQLRLRRQAMQRQKSLKERGVGTDASIETAELSASSAEQAVLAKRLSHSQARSRIARAEIAVSRTRISLDEAKRVFDDTTVYAEFDGVLSGVSAVLGGLINANEKLGDLIDPDALEVVFRVSNAEFVALVRSDAGLKGARVSARFAGVSDGITGKVDRVSAAVGEGQTGREMFAALDAEAANTLRPGDFVTVEVQEPVLHRVAVIPAKAASASGEVLIVAADNRLEAAVVEILRTQGDHLVVLADDLEGRNLVQVRVPQLGSGIRVEPRMPGGAVLQKPETEDTVEVSDHLRKQMIAFVEANKRMPSARKKIMLERLQQPQLPKAMVERLTARMGG
ncbi:MAG: HlyD family efflux transporter periplasmic adaptor subunit [Rhodobacteraceae bacterium]|nr:HlyD family efflux transporter periplasmic adaptor subunit [Paracoccaceae bacterium]